MKKYTFYITIFAATLFACGSNDSNTSSEGGSDAPKVEMSFNMPEKEVQQLTNATGSLSESYGMSCFTFKGDNAKLEVYISYLDLKEQEYLVNVEDLSSPNILNSYIINADGETSNCCGKVEKSSIGSITITSITSEMISGKIAVDNYDGSSMSGSFSIEK
jgi:hypothetical protein